MMNEQGFSEGFVREVIRNGSIQVRDSRILYRHTDIQGKLILVITSLDGEVLSVAV